MDGEEEEEERPRARKIFTFDKTALARAYDSYGASIDRRRKFFLFHSSSSVLLEGTDVSN